MSRGGRTRMIVVTILLLLIGFIAGIAVGLELASSPPAAALIGFGLLAGVSVVALKER
jgi:hypothetical protein